MEERKESRVTARLSPPSADGSSTGLRSHPRPLFLLELQQMCFTKGYPLTGKAELSTCGGGPCHHCAAASRARSVPEGLRQWWPCPHLLYRRHGVKCSWDQGGCNSHLPCGEGKGRMALASKALGGFRNQPPSDREKIHLEQKNKLDGRQVLQ